MPHHLDSFQIFVTRVMLSFADLYAADAVLSKPLCINNLITAAALVPSLSLPRPSLPITQSDR